MKRGHERIDKRRRALIAATGAVGAAGIGSALWPFGASMLPSARAVAAGSPVQADIGRLEPGRMLTIEWRGKPVWLVRRTPRMLTRLEEIAVLLADPDSAVEAQQPPYARNRYRSIRPELLVVVGLCTHLGCVPLARFEPGARSRLGPDWPGGFFCPCHGSKFDMAGRVFKNVPAPTNLVVPPHRYLAETVVEVGVDAA